MTERPALKNRLAEATSPYLLQHADNPVQWQVWDDATLAFAKARDLPILLSIGYAACHWCHVMARESFANPEIAALMNAHFVCIKVDREERPELDDIYMNALALMGEQGGWPLTMFLTPNGAPFFGGTYFPDTAHYGRPSFPQVLTEIATAYRTQRDKINKNADAVRTALQTRLAHHGATEGTEINPAMLPQIASTLIKHMDSDYGGLQGAPKFPQPFLYDFLWRQGIKQADAQICDAVAFALERMCLGGIYDALGGGFARYSVDAQWLVPHFEKMLYDNAQLIGLLARVWQTRRQPLFERAIRETIAWLEADMLLASGAFASSLDADTEGEEGRYYVWTQTELKTLLGDDYDYFSKAYGVTEQGNFEGANILNRLACPPLSDDAIDPRLDACRQILRTARAKRPAPKRDDKSLADWNGLVIQSLCVAAQIFDEPAWRALAINCYRAIMKTHSKTAEPSLIFHAARTTSDGTRVGSVCLGEDQAQMGLAALALFQATNDFAYLADAETRAAALEQYFKHDSNTAYCSAKNTADDLLIRIAPIQDQAVPALNAVALDFLHRLYLLTGKPAYRDRALGIYRHFAALVARNFVSLTSYLTACDALQQGRVLVLAKPHKTSDATAWRRAVLDSDADILLCEIAPDTPLPDTHPAAHKTAQDGKITAYLCTGSACHPAITNIKDLTALLKA